VDPQLADPEETKESATSRHEPATSFAVAVPGRDNVLIEKENEEDGR